MSMRELTTPAMRVMSSDRLGVVPNTAFWMACCSRLLSPSRPVVANTVLVPPVVVCTTPGTVAAALDVDVGEHGSRLRDTREGQVACIGVVARSRPRELTAGAADQFAGRIAGHDRIVIGERGWIRRHRIGRGAERVQGHVQQRLHIGIGIPGQRRAGLIIGQEVARRDDRHMIVVDHLAQRADDRGDLARLDILHVRENQRAVLRELGDVGEVGLGSGGHRRRRQLPPDAVPP